MNGRKGTIEDESGVEMTPDQCMTVLVLAMQKCLEMFSADERDRIITAMPALLRSNIAKLCENDSTWPLPGAQ